MNSISIEKNIQKMLKDSNALLNGHFLLTSGMHSEYYLQCALLLCIPEYAAFAGKSIAASIEEPSSVDMIAAPAVGGIVIGHEVARELGVPFIFYEREDGVMRLRRFPAPSGKKVLVVEDVITTGNSVKEVGEALVYSNAIWTGSACIVDRSDGNHVLGESLVSLTKTTFETYQPDVCPLCRQKIPLVKPGSRK